MAARQLHPNGTVDLLDLPDHFLPEVAAGIIRQAVKEAERDLADDYTHVRQVLESRLLSSERWLSPEDMRQAAETVLERLATAHVEVTITWPAQPAQGPA
jgi:hypothetical protein